MSPSVLVRRLRLEAPDRAAVAAAARTLETALMLAPLPPAAPGELVLVRQLLLGRLPQGIDAQALSLRLARALALVRPRRLRPGDAEAQDAPAVAFAGGIEALAGLGTAIARGGGRAWYWPHVLPGWHPGTAAGPTFRRLLEAAAAPPHGLGGLARLAELLLEARALPPLLLAAGPDPPLPGTPAPAAAIAPPPVARAAEEAAPLLASPLPVALGRPWRGALHDLAVRLPAGDRRLLWLARMALVATFGPAAEAAAPALARHVAAAAGTGRTATLPAPRPAPSPPPAPVAVADAATETEPATPIPEAEPPSLPGTFSAQAGFWLLVAALLRLRVAEVASAFGPALPLHLLHGLAARLGLAAGDPLLLALPAPLPVALPPLPAFRAPAAWRPLAAPRKGAPPAFALRPFPGGWLLTDARGRLPFASAPAPAAFRELIGPHPCRAAPPLARPPPADLALRACRLALQRHLRRHVGIGLRGLVHRPGRVIATATHLDVLFDARLIDIRLRRAGLDLDPGWVPWLGRVVRYHYDFGPEAGR